MRVELEGVCKIFGRTRALEGVSLTLEPGRIVAVVGLNGAGKTTLLHTLAGLLAPSSGRVVMDGCPFSRDRLDLRRRFALLPDFPVVFEDMTAVQHIAMVLHLYGAREDAARVVELMEAFDLTAKGNRFLTELSRGELYKTALTAIIAVEPELWLLDEPLASGMDAHGLHTFRAEARAAVARGATVVYTTQILSEAERFSDEVVVLHHGRLHAHGQVAALQADGDLETLLTSLRNPA